MGHANWKARVAGMVIAAAVGLLSLSWFGFAPRPDRHGDRCSLCADVRMIRSVIEMYNADHPEARYDDSTPAGRGFWDPLVQNGYLDAPPENDLQRGSSVVVTWPREGAGWVWTDSVDPTFLDTGFYALYGIDEDGAIHDHGLNAWSY